MDIKEIFYYFLANFSQILPFELVNEVLHLSFLNFYIVLASVRGMSVSFSGFYVKIDFDYLMY